MMLASLHVSKMMDDNNKIASKLCLFRNARLEPLSNSNQELQAEIRVVSIIRIDYFVLPRYRIF